MAHTIIVILAIALASATWCALVGWFVAQKDNPRKIPMHGRHVRSVEEEAFSKMEQLP